MLIVEIAGGILLAGLVLTCWRGIVIATAIALSTSIVALFIVSVIEKVAR